MRMLKIHVKNPTQTQQKLKKINNKNLTLHQGREYLPRPTLSGVSSNAGPNRSLKAIEQAAKLHEILNS